VAFYADLFKKVIATQEWKDYAEKNALKPDYVIGADLVKFLEKDEAFHNKLMLEAGFGAKK
jgi:tripartite-type tricarboxylate transporter receptor subunit TctC